MLYNIRGRTISAGLVITVKKYYVLIFAVVILIAAGGCGGSNMTAINAAGTGTLAGYVYVKDYNAARAAGRSTAASIPTGYAPLQGAVVEIIGYGTTATTNDAGYFSLSGITNGPQNVRITKYGYQSITALVTIISDAVSSINDQVSTDIMAMDPDNAGTLVISAATDQTVPVPVAATVYLGDTATTFTTPATITDIAAGVYNNVNVRAAGYTDSATQTVTITAGQTSTLTFQLTPADGTYPPVVTITSPAANQQFSSANSITFTATAVDTEDGALSGAQVTWTSSIDGAIGTGTSFTRTLSPGTHTISCYASDFSGKTGVASVSVTVISSATPNTGPAAAIATPVNNQSFSTSQNITFTGTGIDPEDGNLTGTKLVWTSSADGQIGTGNTFQKSGLSVGTHTITLTVTDSNSFTDTDTVTITITTGPAVNNAPTATIITPADPSTYIQNANIFFTGTGTDTEDGAITGSRLVWTSSRDGQIGTGTFFSLATLSVGTHTITLTAYDSAGLSGTATASVTISAAINTAPTPVITTPLNPTTTTTAAAVIFTGTATDTQDGVLTGSSLVWTSNLMTGNIGTGTFFQRTMPAGTHTITLTATDAGNLSAATSTVLIVN